MTKLGVLKGHVNKSKIQMRSIVLFAVLTLVISVVKTRLCLAEILVNQSAFKHSGTNERGKYPTTLKTAGRMQFELIKTVTNETLCKVIEIELHFSIVILP